MRIHVEGDHYIAYDGMNHTLEQEGTFEKGENIGTKKITVLGYYPNVASCMKAMLKIEIMESTAKNLSELKVDLLRIESKMELAMEHVKFQIKKLEVAS